MYYIVNYDRWWNYDKPFKCFKTAFMVHQLLNDNNLIIEFFDGCSKEVVWDNN